MIVITSAAYIGHELAAEFGIIPPCMLPLGNKPLVQWQVNTIREHFPEERLVLSLPQRYKPSIGTLELLSKLEIQIVDVPEDLTLTESLLFVINTVGDDDSLLRILHGDTLINDLPQGNDVVAVAPTQTDYAWEIEVLDNQEEIVWCGYFSFSNKRLLTKYLALARGDFVAAVRSYDDQGRLERYYTSQWFDLGHVNTYFSSRARVTTERSFNALSINNGYVRKTGTNNRKILAEINWYLNIPSRLRLRTPQLLDYGNEDDHPYYALEYLNLMPLNEIFVHGRNPTFFWNRIFSHCDHFLSECVDMYPTPIDKNGGLFEGEIIKDMHGLLVGKTWARLEQFAGQAEISLDTPWFLNENQLPSINEIARRCVTISVKNQCIAGVMHGDFCFSNILFDSRGDTIKVIDPRGINNADRFTIYGDITYDLAKLMHSVVGLYDFILADMYRLDVIAGGNLSFTIFADNRIGDIQQLFLNRSFVMGRLQPRKVMAQVILLFLSMLPLHYENPKRQLALMANALRLYSDFERDL